MFRGWVLGTVVAAAWFAVGACAADGPEMQGDQPAGSYGEFEPGDFAALPKPGAAAPFDDPSVTGTTTAQSFQVAGSSPEQIVVFYVAELQDAGWSTVSAPTEVGEDEWQASWERDDQILEVSAGSGDGSNGGSSQLDLVLTD